ncbi:MAG: lysylphosphatidylglycerol synthase transmembrane domain-containing protein [Bacteroidota bacterium]
MNKKKVIKTIQYIFFLALGILIFWMFYKNTDFEEYKDQLLNNVRWGWVILSFFLGLLSHLSRAIRWNMLIHPMGYVPKWYNSFLAVMVMYLVNFILPRGGELARCGVLTRYEKIPFTKLVGTVVVERLTDTIAMFVFAFGILLIQLKVVYKFFEEHPDLREGLIDKFSGTSLYIIIGAVLVFIILLYLTRGLYKNKVGGKVKSLYLQLVEGINTIRKMKNAWAYIGHTLFIYAMWLVTMWMFFFSFEPTEDLSLLTAATVFVMSGLAMILPIQSGLGAFHFMVVQTIMLFGVSMQDGKFFAFLAHGATNGMLIISGILSLILLVVVNKKTV